MQEPVKILSSRLHYPQVSDQYWRNNKNSKDSVDKEIFDKSLKSFVLVSKGVLFFHNESLIRRKRNVKSLSDKAFDEHVTYGSLSFAFHINKWYDLVDVVPNEGPNIAHDAHAFHSCFYGKREHLIRPVIIQKVHLIEMVALTQNELLVDGVVLVKVFWNVANHMLLYLSVVEVLFPGILEDDKD